MRCVTTCSRALGVLDGEDHDDRDRSGRRIEDGLPPVRKARPQADDEPPATPHATGRRRPPWTTNVRAGADVAAPRAMRSSLGRRVLCRGSGSGVPWSTFPDQVVDLLSPLRDQLVGR